MRIFVVHFLHFVHFHTQGAGYEHLTQRPKSAILAQSAQSAHSAYAFFLALVITSYLLSYREIVSYF